MSRSSVIPNESCRVNEDMSDSVYVNTRTSDNSGVYRSTLPACLTLAIMTVSTRPRAIVRRRCDTMLTC